MTTPLYLEVKAALELEILSGCIPPGQKLPSIRVLAGQWETGLVTGRRGEALQVAPDAEQITYRRQEKATADVYKRQAWGWPSRQRPSGVWVEP